jgi:hypothetical protein
MQSRLDHIRENLLCNLFKSRSRNQSTVELLNQIMPVYAVLFSMNQVIKNTQTSFTFSCSTALISTSFIKLPSNISKYFIIKINFPKPKKSSCSLISADLRRYSCYFVYLLLF